MLGPDLFVVVTEAESLTILLASTLEIEELASNSYCILYFFLLSSTFFLAYSLISFIVLNYAVVVEDYSIFALALLLVDVVEGFFVTSLFGVVFSSSNLELFVN